MNKILVCHSSLNDARAITLGGRVLSLILFVGIHHTDIGFIIFFSLKNGLKFFGRKKYQNHLRIRNYDSCKHTLWIPNILDVINGLVTGTALREKSNSL
jgi:hypothetical protein